MFSSILIPLDGSEYSQRAMATGLDLARLTGAKVTVLTVVLGYKDAHVPAAPQPEAQTRQRAQAYLQPFVDDGRALGFEIVADVRHGDPAEEILRSAREHESDVIVMSTHGFGSEGRHPLGRVALKVLQTAECPVLLVRINGPT